MDKSWQDSVVLIVSSDPGEQSFGTGFVIHRDQQATYLLTCTHVVREVGGPEKIQIDASPVKVVASSPEEDADLAILSLEGLPDTPSLPLRVAGEKGKPFNTVGFQLAGKQIVIRELFGTLGKQVGVQMRRQAGRIKAWDLEITDKDPLQSGYSGSPVIDERGYVIGVVITQRGAGKIGAAISIEALEKLQSEMPSDLFIQIVRLAPFQVQYDAAMQAQRWDEAQVACTEALRLAPEDGGWQQRQARVRTARASAELLTAPRPSLGTLLWTYSGHSDGVLSVVWSPDGTRLASASQDKTVQVWEASDGRLLHTYCGHSYAVNAVAWSPDGLWLASGSNNPALGDDLHKPMQVWEASDGRLLRTYIGHTSYVHAVAWSPDGSRLASASQDKTVQVWEASSLLRTYRGHSNGVQTVAWSPDGTRLASGSDDKTVQVWEASSGRLLRTYRGHSKEVEAVVWSPDGMRIASASYEEVQVWEVSSGRLLRRYSSHSNWVRSVVWSPDGTRLASSSDDDTVQMWEVGSGRLLHTYTGHTSSVYAVAWSPDGTRIASASADKTVQIWQAV